MKLETASIMAAILFLSGLLAGCDPDAILDALDRGSSGGSTSQPIAWENCPEARDGSWNFGRAPRGCELALVGDAELVRTEFSGHIFDDAAPRSDERQRYMTAFQAWLAAEAEAYLLERREADEAEREAWRRAVFATAHQESFWTHYRKTAPGDGGVLTMLRGDMGHGHGLMQIDDRWHTNAIENGVGWHLEENLVYALDIYFGEWERAPDAECVDMPDDFKARARAAYAAYNGGPQQLCRWTNPDDPWAQNDEGYEAKYIYQEWNDHVVE